MIATRGGATEETLYYSNFFHRFRLENGGGATEKNARTVAVDCTVSTGLLSVALDLLPPALVARPSHPSTFL